MNIHKQERPPLPLGPELQPFYNENPLVKQGIDSVREEHADKEYHKIEHTIDVTQTALELAKKEGYDDKKIEDTVIASVWHDWVQGENAEEKSASEVEKELKKAGYSEDRITRIAEAIEGTKIDFVKGKHREPKNEIEEVLQDADVANFGRGDFMVNFWAIFKETRGTEFENASEKDQRKALENVLKLLKNHTWKTDSARKLYEEKKQENIEMLENYLQSTASDSQESQ